jgi:hypothetical protein
MSQTKAQLLDNIKDNVQLDARNALRFADTDSSHYVAFKAPATVSSNVTWTLPAADGSANYVLATDGSGNLSWIADPAGQWVTSGSNIYFTGGNVGIGDSSPSNPLSVTGASAFNGDVTFTGASYNVTWDKSADDLIFNDNAKAAFGTSSDLTIFHDGSNSYIKDSGTGALRIQTNHLDIINAANNEQIAKFVEDGAVELYYNGSKKFETYNGGCQMGGDLSFSDSQVANFGTGSDLQIYHDGSNSWLKDNGTGNLNVAASAFAIKNAAANENMLAAAENGNVELFYDNSKKLETTADGVKVTDDGAYQLTLKRDGSAGQQSGIKFIDGGDATGRIIGYSGHVQIGVSPSSNSYEDAIMCNSNGSVDLFYDNSKKFETTSAGATVTGQLTCTSHINLGDGDEIKLGAGEDLLIFHDGSDSYIKDAGTGLLVLQSNYLRVNNAAGNETIINAIENGAVELYHNNVKTFATGTNGATVYGSQSNNAYLELFADQGDQNVDKWMLVADDGGSSIFSIQNYAQGQWEKNIECQGDGNVELYYDNSKKFETTSSGVNITGQTLIGTTSSNSANHELIVSGDGTPSYYANGAGLLVQVTNSNDNNCAEFFQGRYNKRVLTHSHSNTGSVTFDVFEQNDSNVGSITGNGSATAFNTSSDYRLKENIVNITDGITRLKQLIPRRFNWILDSTNTLEDGFIAHEVSSVIPEAVTGEKDALEEDGSIEPQAMDYGKVTPLLTAALQEAITKIETLETKVAALESA